jgi:nicotinate-nucleotide adenylyltransferase
MADAAHRVAMTRLAFAEHDRVTVDDRELHREGLSYTVDTLEELRSERPGVRLYFLIGSDNLPLLPTWHEHHRLLELATVVTWPRAGYPIDEEQLRGLDLTSQEQRELAAHALQLPADDVSASELRARLRAGERRPPTLPQAVADYAAAHALYR